MKYRKCHSNQPCLATGDDIDMLNFSCQRNRSPLKAVLLSFKLPPTEKATTGWTITAMRAVGPALSGQVVGFAAAALPLDIEY